MNESLGPTGTRTRPFGNQGCPRAQVANSDLGPNPQKNLGPGPLGPKRPFRVPGPGAQALERGFLMIP